ncbi:hypothetical protein [Persicobacter diffluens]|uniref:Uncharacterized protein n=1 Tax=Persicobacter diffluens TaxID=981 RepID=A0AAN4W1C2_9BACT|nr:hypothetical protein PEDI_30590 [Persicobacter diffluens]
MNLKYFFLIGLNLFFYSKGKSQKQEIETVWRQVAPGMAGSNRAIFTDAVDANKI